MQRFHFLRWLALAIAVCSLQCLESLSDDCTKTLTCGNEPHARLDSQCLWRFPDGGQWVGGPKRSPEGRWTWPNGRESESFDCVPQFDAGTALPVGDSGGPGGVEGDCNDPTVACDAPLVCDTVTGRCVTCLDNTQCVSATDPSIGPLPICDPNSHACVACLRNGDCPAGTDQCKTDASDSTRNECVRCLNNSHCPASEPVCDTATGECAARCTGPGLCPIDKVCSIVPGATAGLCVQCVNDTTCSPATPQCNLTTKQCVPCVGSGAGIGACNANQVCNSLNECVECVGDEQCGTGEKPRCDINRNKCVACLNSGQCLSPTASRCNTADSVCAACTSDVQCESDLPYCAGGRCVACKEDSQCAGGEDARCDLMEGVCVSCLNNGDCRSESLARCDTATHECAPCSNDGQCGGRFGIRQLCNEGNGTCVQCSGNIDCALDSQKARCDGSGLCAGCQVDTDCLAIEGRPACAGGNGNNGRCVECTDNTDCAGKAATPACKVTAGGNSAPVNTCVQCVVDGDCPNPAAARCDDNVCVACADDTSCGHVTVSGTRLPVCDTSVSSPVCVECTGLKRGACGPDVCNSLTKVCADGQLANSRERCESCLSDAHCATGERCARQVFDGTDLGFFCFPVGETQACPPPYAELVESSVTIDNQSVSLCVLRLTSCAGLDDFAQSQSCTNNAGCGAANLDDGRCNTNLGQCSIPCAAGSDCPAGVPLACQDGACDL